MAVVKTPVAVGKDIIYVCQNPNCRTREKEYAFSDRHYKYCSKCGSISVKSTLADSYNYLSPTFVDPSQDTEDYD